MATQKDDKKAPSEKMMNDEISNNSRGYKKIHPSKKASLGITEPQYAIH